MRKPWRFRSARAQTVKKATRFYSGCLDAQRVDSYLPRVLSNVPEGKLDRSDVVQAGGRTSCILQLIASNANKVNFSCFYAQYSRSS